MSQYRIGVTTPQLGLSNPREGRFDLQPDLYGAMLGKLGGPSGDPDIIERLRQTNVQAAALLNLQRRKDEFLAMVSHELRNPLAPIVNAVQLLRLHQGRDNPMQEQACAIIERQVGRLTRLVDDLLDVSRVNADKILLRQEWVVVGDIAARAVETAQPLIAQRKHELTVSAPLAPIWLYADADRLEQVLVNLLNNAAKYTDEGGHISLTVLQEGDECVIQVEDTGIGIAPELLPHIFDMFAQGAQSLGHSQGGLGIGLCLVHRLVKLHGGSVDAYSVLGRGSRLVVRLPIVATAIALLRRPDIIVGNDPSLPV